MALQVVDRIIYSLVLGLFELLTGTFFREIHCRNSHSIPKHGAVLFVAAPHVNQFVDPMILATTSTRRPVRFLIAAASMRRALIGLVARWIRCIPVERPGDVARPAPGRIRIQGRRVLGEGTRFSQIKLFVSVGKPSHCLLVTFPGVAGGEPSSLPIESVVSDEELLLQKPLPTTSDSGSYEGDWISTYKVAPILDQSHVYEQVVATLARGEAVAIFPEGGSHDRTTMLPLKAGVSVMALATLATHPGLDLHIVPCGLNYFHPHQFRSRAVIEYGQPFQVPAELVQQFKAGGEERRRASAALLQHIHARLCDVTINLPDFETLQLIQALRRLYRPPDRILSSYEQLELTRRLVAGYRRYATDPRIIAVKERVLTYNRQLRYLGLKDHQVMGTDVGRLRGGLLLLANLLLLGIFGLASLPGVILNGPALLLIDRISQRAADRAKAASTVKLEGRDVLATWKLMVGLVLLPLLDAIYAGLLAYLLRWHLKMAWGPVIRASLFVAIIVLPLITYLTVRFAEIGMERLRALSPLWYALLRPDHGSSLRELRHGLRLDIKGLVDILGPTVIPDFNHQRIIPKRKTSVLPEMAEDEDAAGGGRLSPVYSAFEMIRSGLSYMITSSEEPVVSLELATDDIMQGSSITGSSSSLAGKQRAIRGEEYYYTSGDIEQIMQQLSGQREKID